MDHRQHRRLIKTYLRDVCSKSQTGSILALLIESGSIYCLMWVSNTIVLHIYIYIHTSFKYVQQISFFVVAVWSGFWENYTGNILVLGSMVQISVRHIHMFFYQRLSHSDQGSYPTAVIALAAFQKTAWDMSIGRASRNVPERHATLGHTHSAASTIQIGYSHHISALDGGSKGDSAPADMVENV